VSGRAGARPTRLRRARVRQAARKCEPSAPAIALDSALGRNSPRRSEKKRLTILNQRVLGSSPGAPTTHPSRLYGPRSTRNTAAVSKTCGPIFLTCAVSAHELAAHNHKGNLATDIVDTKPTAGVEPEHSPIHGAKHRQTEVVPVAVGVEREFVDETRENLFILVTLTDQLPYALEIVWDSVR